MGHVVPPGRRTRTRNRRTAGGEPRSQRTRGRGRSFFGRATHLRESRRRDDDAYFGLGPLPIEHNIDSKTTIYARLKRSALNLPFSRQRGDMSTLTASSGASAPSPSILAERHRTQGVGFDHAVGTTLTRRLA